MVTLSLLKVFFFSTFFRCRIYVFLSESTLPTLLCKHYYQYIEDFLSYSLLHTFKLLHGHTLLSTIDPRNEKRKRKKKGTMKLLCMLQFSGTETNKQSPTFFKNCLSSPLHYILQSLTKIQFLLFLKLCYLSSTFFIYFFFIYFFYFYLFSKVRQHLYLPSLQSTVNQRDINLDLQNSLLAL